jgi:DNA-binding beta-propeller fold protein YncE
MSQRDHIRDGGRPAAASMALAVAMVTTIAALRFSAQTAPPFPTPPASSPAGPLAYSCGVPPNPAPAGRGAPPVFPAGQYPVRLPPVSMLGAHNDLPNPYNEGVDWGHLPPGRKWGSTASIATAPDGTIWVADRCGNSGAGGTTCSGANAAIDPIFQFDSSGRLLKSAGAGLFVSPHKLTIDKDGFLWLADNGAHQVFKLDKDGKVLMTLGKKGIAGAGDDEFDAPTEVAIADNGEIFVADGHSGGGTAIGNARVVKFDKTGRFLKAWGRKGMGPGEFDVPHTIGLDSRGRVFVGDRQNNRIQVFQPDGAFVAVWYQFGRPSGLFIDKRTDTLYVADSESRDGRTNTGQFALGPTGYGYNPGARRGIRIGSARDGSVRYFVPDPCPYPYPAASSLAEGVTIDSQGNMYGADFLMNVRKFVKK